jgi:hypothetical protein
MKEGGQETLRKGKNMAAPPTSKPASASTKPVTERLQLKPGRTLAILNAPPGQEEAIGAQTQRAPLPQADIVLLYVHTHAEWTTHLPKTRAALKPTAILWLAYPKLTSKLAADLNRDIIHTLAQSHAQAGCGKTLPQIGCDLIL